MDGLSLGLHWIGVLAGLRLVACLLRRRAVTLDSLRESHRSRVADQDDGGAALAQRSSPSEVFDGYLAAPLAHPASMALSAGHTWLFAGPYAGVVFAFVLSMHALAVPLLRTPITLALVPVACAPYALWWWRGRPTRLARGGVAMLLTPTLVIVRDAQGSRSVRWSDVQELGMASRQTWDVLRGARRAPQLVIGRRGTHPLVLTEDELHLTVAAALGVLQAYRSGVVASGAGPAGDVESLVS